VTRLPVIYPLSELPKKGDRETEDETESDSGGSTFIYEMDVRGTEHLKKQEARWI
jgi:hypothetical protein